MTPRTFSLDILQAPSLAGMAHGFFTRRGGASSGIFDGLNCGAGSSDQAAVVATNRDRVAMAMDVPPERLVTLNQVHSADVAVLDGAPQGSLKVDAAVTKSPGLALGILTADCQPVLFADPDARVVGAAHAGWRGTIDGILEATVEAMVDLGAQRHRIRAAIGPSISQANYEVGPEFQERFVDHDPETTRYFINGAQGKYLFDLPAYGLSRLRAAGVAEAEWTRHCTYADPTRFYSFRRSVHRGEADYGRLIAVIRL